ncbi:hypothetical protein AMECASPLE_007600 [Ameca splendens]|uniref:Secreted protein n=1 Tax=Ameca splendens TaxID=208324 RepID=A0ABV0Z9Q5_9TELE
MKPYFIVIFYFEIILLIKSLRTVVSVCVCVCEVIGRCVTWVHTRFMGSSCCGQSGDRSGLKGQLIMPPPQRGKMPVGKSCSIICFRLEQQDLLSAVNENLGSIHLFCQSKSCFGGKKTPAVRKL